MATSKIKAPMTTTTLFEATNKIDDGTATLSEAYTNFDAIEFHFKVNSDWTHKMVLSSDIILNEKYSETIWAGSNYVSACAYTFTSATSITIASAYTNVNFKLGLQRVIGINI